VLKTQLKRIKTVEKEEPKDTIEIDYEEYEISDSTTYNTNYTDNDWAETEVNIDEIKIDKLVEPTEYESLENGNYDIDTFAQLHISISPNCDNEQR